MKNSSNDIQSYSALNLKVECRDKNLLSDKEELIKPEKIEIKAASKINIIEENESENYLNHKHTEKIKPLTHSQFEEEEFILNSRLSKKKLNQSEIKSERDKPHSQFYEQYTKQSRYIPVHSVIKTNSEDVFEVIDMNYDKDEKSDGKACKLSNKKSNGLTIEENNPMQDIFNQGEITIGISKHMESLETNRGENHINIEENQPINISDSTFENKSNLNKTISQAMIEQNELKNSLEVQNANNLLGIGNIKNPIALNIKDNPVRPNSSNTQKENSNSRVQYCRICYEEESEEKGGLIYPCNCTGSCQYIHESCLKKWIENNYMDHKVKAECEICKHEYIMKFYIKWKFRKHKLCNTLKSLLSVVLVTSIILALVFTVIYVVVTALSEMNEREKKNFIKILAGVGGGVLLLVIILSLRKCKKSFYEQHLCDWKIFNVDGTENKKIVNHEVFVNKLINVNNQNGVINHPQNPQNIFNENNPNQFSNSQIGNPNNPNNVFIINQMNNLNQELSNDSLRNGFVITSNSGSTIRLDNYPLVRNRDQIVILN